MQLAPKGPPGRSNRKARAYHAEIHRLRAAGYTFEAIREALQDVGIEVSRATVKREAAKPAPDPTALLEDVTGGPQPQGAAHRAQAIGLLSPGRASAMPSMEPRSFINDGRTGKQIVEDFMKGRTTNPLLQEGN